MQYGAACLCYGTNWCSMVQHASVMAPIGGGQGGHEPTLHRSNPAEVPSLIKRGWPQANGQLPVTKTCPSMHFYASVMPTEQFQHQIDIEGNKHVSSR